MPFYRLTNERAHVLFVHGEIDLIHDAHDRRIHRRHFLADGVAGRSPLEHDQHLLVDARADAVHGQQLRTARRVFERQRLHEQQLCAFELSILLGGDERAGHAREDHVTAYPMCQESTMPTMPASAGTSMG